MTSQELHYDCQRRERAILNLNIIAVYLPFVMCKKYRCLLNSAMTDY